MQFNELIDFMLGNITVLFLLGIAFLILLFTVFSIINPKRVKVKKRIMQQDSAFSQRVDKLINKVGFLTKIRESIRIQLGLVTSKSEVRNEYYASVMVFSIMMLFACALVITLFIDIPLMFKPLLLLICVLTPYLLMTIYVKARRKKIYNDFPELVSVFIAKYASTQNTKEALRKSIPDLPYSLKHEVKRLVNSMNHAESYFKALDEFDMRVNYVMCTAFVALLKAGYKTNHDIIHSLLDLESYISQERLESHRKVEELKDKKANIYFLIVSMIVTYFGMVNRLGEKAINFYWHTMQGQMVVAACIIFSIISIAVIAIEDAL